MAGRSRPAARSCGIVQYILKSTKRDVLATKVVKNGGRGCTGLWNNSLLVPEVPAPPPQKKNMKKVKEGIKSWPRAWVGERDDHFDFDLVSGVAIGGVKAGQSATPDSEKLAKNRGKKRGKSGKIGKKEVKSGRKAKIGKVFFTLPLLTDRAGYATGFGSYKV